MKILIDTNVLFSALLYPQSTPAKAVDKAAQFEKIVLCEHIVLELRTVIGTKYPGLLDAVNALIEKLPHEIFDETIQREVSISDKDDQPILNAAIAGRVDIIISGDKHFTQLKLRKPRVLTPKQFLDGTF